MSTTPNVQVNHVLQLDPSSLLVDVNVRHSSLADETLIESVRDLGVLQAIVAVRTAEGQVRVRYGHRRTHAAIAAQRPTVPVVIVADEATDDAASVDRLVSQWAENEHRAGLTRAEQVDVIGQLAAFGVSPSQIAKRTRTPRATVTAALAVQASQAAREATARGDLDITQAAIVAEFEDEPEAVERLVKAAQARQLEHVAQRLRDERDERRRREAKVAELRAAGLTVVAEPGWSSAEPVRRLSDLIGTDGTPLTEDDHATCPGHAVYITEVGRWVNPADVPYGADIEDTDEYGYEYSDVAEDFADDDEDQDDGGDQGDDTGEGDGEGERVARPAARVFLRELGTLPVCVGWVGHGHRDRYSRTTATVQPRSSNPEDIAAAAEAERARKLAERRDVIASNKAWKSATTVRIEWVTRVLARKTAPKGTAAFLALALAHRDADHDGRSERTALACTWLGRKPETTRTGMYGYSNGREVLAEMLDTATEARAQVLTLAVILAGYESNTDTNSWRHRDGGTTRYLSFLAAHGYELSDIERRACGLAPRAQDEGEQDATDPTALTD